jgi:hypothetical protein
MIARLRQTIGVASLGWVIAASLAIPPQSLQEIRRMASDEHSVRQDVPLDRELVKRWAELFSYVITEFREDHRDATAEIEADYSTLYLRIHKLQGAENDWVGRRLTVEELRTADLRALAKRLYALSKDPAAPRS